MNESWKDGVQFVWDSTSISLAQSCLRKYYYKMIEGWVPKRPSVHLRFGAHYATALEHFYKLRHVEGKSYDEALREVVREALLATWEREQLKDEEGNPLVDAEGNPLLGGDGKPWLSDDPNKTRETLIRTIIWYCEEFKDDTTQVKLLADGSPAVEHSFMLPVDNGVIFSGHLDRVVEYSGDVYVMDQKTTKAALSAYYFDKYKPHTQMSMYTFAGQAILAAPVKGVIIDAAQIAVGFTRFTRGFTFRTEPELAEWYDSTMFWIVQAQNASREQYFPMNPAACDQYGGCEFRHICSRAPSVRENFLRADFLKTSPWNPAQRR